MNSQISEPAGEEGLHVFSVIHRRVGICPDRFDLRRDLTRLVYREAPFVGRRRHPYPPDLYASCLEGGS